MGRYASLVGERFGRLVVLARGETYTSPKGKKMGRWTCVCDCGKSLTVLGQSLRTGHTRSCGCLLRDVTSERSSRRGPLNHTWRGDDIGYQAAHLRVKKARGSAVEHPCIDCGGTAREWSYTGGCPRELVAGDGPWRGITYSPDPERYVPRCVPCHRRFDMAAREAA